MRTFITLLFLSFASTGLLSQTFGEIKGKVSTISGEPIPLTNVYVRSGERIIGSTTDFDGRFTIKPLEAGNYNVHVTNVQYDSLLITGVRVDPDNITFLNDLTMGVNTLNAVEIITYTEDLIKKDNPSLISISGPSMKYRSDRRDQVKMISAMVPGVKLTDDGRQLYFRGARPQNVSTFIDGVKIMGSQIPSLPSSALKRVSVYTGGVPAKYGDVTGGVIIMETKSYMDFWNERQAEMKRKEMDG